MFVGHGRAGKDTACEYLAKITGLVNAGTTSKYLAEYVAQKQGLPVEVAYARRHESDEMRTFWYNAGNELREQGPTTLIRTALKHGDITGGVRDYEEIVAARREGIVDIIVWVENNRVPKDPTVKFTERECDLVIQNNWSMEEFEERIRRFAKFAGLPQRESVGKHVHVVLHQNYGDQGVDYLGVFDTRASAERYVAARERNPNDRQWYDILDTQVVSYPHDSLQPGQARTILDRTKPSSN